MKTRTENGWSVFDAGNLASLILLAQHISTLLQAPNIAAATGKSLMEAVRAEIAEEVTSGDDLPGLYR
jgi:hypothetical protein